MKNNSQLAIIAVVFLYLPTAFILIFAKDMALPSLDEFLWASKNSLYQASLSAIGSVVLGLGMGRGLLAIKMRFGKLASFCEFGLLLPSALPPIVSLLCLLGVLQPFPRNVIGIAIANVFIYVGLIAVSWSKILQLRLADSAELAAVEGASERLFWKAALPSLRSDFLFLFGMVFASTFSSLSVPLVVGGSGGTTLEVLILEKLRFESNSGVAVTLSILQLAFLSMLFLSLKTKNISKSSRPNTLYLTSRPMALLVFIYSIFIPLSFLTQISSGISALFEIEGIQNELINLSINSIYFGTVFLFCILVFVLFFGILWIQNSKWFGAIKAFVAPSTALLGLSLFFIQQKLGISPWVTYFYGVLLLAIPFLLKNGIEAALASLQSEIEVAKVFGADAVSIFVKVVYPQIAPQIFWACSLASIWAVGEFAMGRILLERDSHLAMLVESLMSSYRIDAAFGVLGFLILVFVLIYLLGLGGKFVLSKKHP